MVNKVDFKAKNLTSNAGIFLLFEYAKNEGIFDIIENNLVFDNKSTNKIKMNHIKTTDCPKTYLKDHVKKINHEKKNMDSLHHNVFFYSRLQFAKKVG